MAIYDVVIIGSGPGGYVAAIRAAQLGLKTAIVEKDDRFGGTCLLRGCIPTKALLESAELYEHARKAKDFGVVIEGLSLDLGGVMRRKKKVVEQNAGGVAYLLKKNKVDTLRGFGTLEGPGRVRVQPDEGEAQVVQSRYVVLATGSAPRALPFAKIDGKRVLTSDDILELDEVPKHLIVLGSGAVGVEFASVYRSFGADVTVVEMLDRLVPVEDHEVSAEFAKVFRRRRIKALTSTRVTAVETTDTGVRIEYESDKGETKSLRGSHLLVAVGRRPVTEKVGLETTKAKVDRGYVEVDAFMRTAEPTLYAIGDITTRTPMLAHAASAEGILAAEHIAGKHPPAIEPSHVPWCTYSQPEIGGIGLTEQAAKDAGYDVKTGKFPFSAIGKAKILGDTNGFVKIVADEQYGEILGVHIIGPRATELIAEAGPLLRLECTVEELVRTIHAHPTLSEAIGEAAHATHDRPIHL